jgi:hypothetical protein
MKKVIRYEVIYANSEGEFVEQINKMINEGWQPLGGVGITYIEKQMQVVYHQAMVEYEKASVQEDCGPL